MTKNDTRPCRAAAAGCPLPGPASEPEGGWGDPCGLRYALSGSGFPVETRPGGPKGSFLIAAMLPDELENARHAWFAARLKTVALAAARLSDPIPDAEAAKAALSDLADMAAGRHFPDVTLAAPNRVERLSADEFVDAMLPGTEYVVAGPGTGAKAGPPS